MDQSRNKLPPPTVTKNRKRPASSSSSSDSIVTVHIVPVLGIPFTITCPQSLSVEKFKEDVSDRIGISSKKMSLLFRTIELKCGTLAENGLTDGSEVTLVPALESGVNTATVNDPLVMMKHSMSGISDQQIDDFLAGKVPLSVAIRMGESVVVVNLNRAKGEDIDTDPPLDKRHAHHTASKPRPNVPEKHNNSLNSNPHWSSSAECRSTSSVTAPPCSVPVRSVIPAGTPIPSADLSTPSSHLGNALDDHRNLWTTPLPTNRRRQREESDSPSSSPIPSSSIPTTHIPVSASPPASTISLPPSPLIDAPVQLMRPTKKARHCSKGGSVAMVTGKPPKCPATSQSECAVSSSKEVQNNESLATPTSGMTMKRKAVMEAIGEILKKMYSQRSRGKAPGTFKGRFSSEFTCDSEMQEIIHSRTTMTSYGNSSSSLHGDHTSSRRSRMLHSSIANGKYTKARYEENKTTKSKIELLKWKLQRKKMLRQQQKDNKNNGNFPSSSIEGLVEGAIDIDLQPPLTKMAKKTGFGGLKQGFLL